jgi:hypothetical protein
MTGGQLPPSSLLPAPLANFSSHSLRDCPSSVGLHNMCDFRSVNISPPYLEVDRAPSRPNRCSIWTLCQDPGITATLQTTKYRKLGVLPLIVCLEFELGHPVVSRGLPFYNQSCFSPVKEQTRQHQVPCLATANPSEHYPSLTPLGIPVRPVAPGSSIRKFASD